MTLIKPSSVAVFVFPKLSVTVFSSPHELGIQVNDHTAMCYQLNKQEARIYNSHLATAAVQAD